MASLCHCNCVVRSFSPPFAEIRRKGVQWQHGLQVSVAGSPLVVACRGVVSRGCLVRIHASKNSMLGDSLWSGNIRTRKLALEEILKWRVRSNELAAGWSFSAVAEDPDKALVTLPKGATEEDAEYMRMAVQLARKALGHTSPNPMVGCVIVKSGQIVGRGFHPKAGEPHAEVFALREAGDKAKGATAYVSLEPCNHTGRTPPCSQALVRAQVQRVVVGTVDPNPLVGGMGLKTLQNAGIEVVVGVEEALCRATAEAFFHRISTRKPFVTLRYVMSLDGALLESHEDTPRGGQHYSLLLQEHDVVVLTANSVNRNRTLLSSEPGAKQPLRVVLAQSLDMPLESPVFDTKHAPTLIITDVKASNRQEQFSVHSALRSQGVEVLAVNELTLHSVLDLLYQRGFSSVLLDLRGLEFSALSAAEQAAQKLVVVIAPVIVGGDLRGPGQLFRGELSKLQRVSSTVEDSNVIIEGYFKKD